VQLQLQLIHQAQVKPKSSIQVIHSLSYTIFTLSHCITLNIPIIIFACPDESSFWFDHISNHIVDKPVLIPNFLLLKNLFIFFIVDGFKYIFKSSIVLFQNSIFSGQVEGIIPLNCKFKTTFSKLFNAIISVIHSQTNSFTLKFIHLHALFFSTLPFEHNLKSARFIDYEISCLILISKCVPSNYDRLFPTGNESRNITNKNGLSKNSAVEYISDGTIWTLPHFF